MVKQGKAIRRRDFVKAVAIGGLAAGVGVGALGASMISLVPPATFQEFVVGSYGFTYTAGTQQDKSWFKPLVGKPVKASDFPLNGGALAFWDGVPVLKPCWILYLNRSADHTIPTPGGGTAQVSGFSAPLEAEVVDHGSGVFVGLYGGCVHACCIPGWKEVLQYKHLDIFHCTCHNSRYDPWNLVEDVDEKGRKYLGALRLELPAQRNLPYIPLELQGDRLLGKITEENKDWYGYCGVKKKEGR